MQVLMLSTDPKVLEQGSAVRRRMHGYGTLFDHLHVVLCTPAASEVQILGSSVALYPVGRCTKIGALIRGYTTAAGILRRGDLSTPWVITAQDPFEIGFIGVLLSWRYAVPLHVQIHTDITDSYFVRANLKNMLRVIIARLVIPRAHALRVVSRRMQQALIARWPQVAHMPIVVLPIHIVLQDNGGAPTLDLKKRYPQPTHRVLMASRLEAEKDINLAIEAWPQVVSHVPGAMLIIVGEGSYAEQLRSLAAHIAPQSVMFEPWQSSMVGVYASADVFLLTSEFEGYGMTLAEAATAGVSIVSTDVGIARDVGAYITEHSAQSVADAVVRALTERRRPIPVPVVSKEAYLAAFKESIDAAYTAHTSSVK